MKSLKKLRNAFLSATAVGIYITILLTALCFSFLDARNYLHESKLTPLYKTLEIAHLKTIDLRFLSRGPIEPSSQVALLAIDEKAVTIEGRWPWPREKFAKAMEKAVQLGAKVLSLDIVFSEESNHPIKNFYSHLSKETNITESLNEKFKSEIIRTDGDQVLSETIKKYNDNIILGTFSESQLGDNYGFYAACFSFIYQLQKEYTFWDNDEIPLIVIDSNEFYIPDMIADTYKSTLKARAEATESSFPKPKTSQERKTLKHEVEKVLANYCENWLNPEYDEVNEDLSELWASLKEEDEDIEQNSFEEWAEHIKSEFLSTVLANRSDWVMNIDKLSLAGKHTGYFNATQDLDGTIRRNSLVSQSGSNYYPSIGLKAFLVANNYNAQLEIEPEASLSFAKKSVKRLAVTDNDTGDEIFEIPVDIRGNMMINYVGTKQMFPHISIAELLNENETATIEQVVFNSETNQWNTEAQQIEVNKKEWFKDKIFIVGATAIGIYDLRVTPFEKNFPGPETHVSVIDNLVRQDFLKSYQYEEAKLPIYIFIFGLILSLSLSHLGAVYGFVLTVLLGLGIILVDKYYYFNKGTVTTIIFPLMTVGLVYVIVTFYKYFTEERKKKELKGTFAKYVSPSIVDEVLKDPENLELGGRKERMTVFFSDIRGFTTISEKLDPQALTKLLNEYLTPMTEIVFNNKGTLDKYMGDAIMAFFGAPLHYGDHAAYACRACLQSLEKLSELQIDFAKRGLPTIDIGIGLNTGDMNVGNMGSATVMSYTVMGDAVNLGSRLEGINKQYGTRIIISEFTYSDVKDKFTCREIDWVRVKGKLEPVKIFELVAEGAPEATKKQLLDHFNKGFELYHNMNFTGALDEFSQGLNIIPEDKCSQLYMERCQGYIDTPPPEDWDGVFTMTTK